MTISKTATLAIALLLTFSAAACGSNDGDHLTKSEISSQLQDKGVPEKSADCIAEKAEGHNLTKEDVDAFASDPKEDTKVGKALVSALTSCMETFVDGG